jgi:hypothetical protein
MTISSTTTATNTKTGRHTDDVQLPPPSTDTRDQRQNITDPSVVTTGRPTTMHDAWVLHYTSYYLRTATSY